MYDAIVVGARCAGSPTAMLLARQGYRVLLVDKARFPSDTMSGHFIHASGIIRLKRWGLLDRLQATGCPAISSFRVDAGPFVLEGQPLALDGVAEMYGPRRTVIDALLVDAAVEAGVELRQGFTVHEIIEEDGRVAGIRGRSSGGATVTERARIVIGADGRHSLVARAVQAPAYNTMPVFTCMYYSYWQGVEIDRLEVWSGPDSMVLAFPTHDNLALVLAAWPAAAFKTVRSDIEGHFLRAVERAPELAARVNGAPRAERFVGTVDLPNFFRKPFGPGWALVGDAGYHKDPWLAQGMADAFRDAELLAGAVDAGLAGRAELDTALADYESQRNAAAMPGYEHNCQRASFAPPRPEALQFMQAVSRSKAESDRYVSALFGTLPYQEVFAPENIQRVMSAAQVAV
jgi:2-polyprenyl-6-methoxyphenol hydroxylase-like FAD-dependent oxidoreductase